MYVCLCNALSDRQLRQAVQDGAHRPFEIYAACGCCAQCGRCVRTLLAIIRGSDAPGVQASQEA